jgi:GNAT superfamily N-acetyltransferase
MEGVPIRNARRGDIPSLLLLWEGLMKEHAALDGRLALHPRAREHMANELARWLGDDKHFVVVAEEGRRLVVGFAAAVLVRGNGWQVPDRLARVTDCFVVGPRRRHGIGRRLVGRLVDLVYEKGVDTVRLSAASQNPGALAFWESMGWESLDAVYEKEVERDAPRG